MLNDRPRAVFGWPLLTLLALLHLLPFASRPSLLGGDEPHYALMARSLGVEHELALEDDYAAVQEGSSAAGTKFAGRTLEHHLIEIHGARYFSHPLGLPLLAAPLLAMTQSVLPGSAPDVSLAILTLVLTFGALVAGLVMLRQEYGYYGMLGGVVTYFGTPLWFYSRTFFTEPYIVALLLFAMACWRSRRFFVSGLLAGAAFWMKESSLLLILPAVALCISSREWKQRTMFLSSLSMMVTLWLLKNERVYGSPFVTFQPFRLGDPMRNLMLMLLSRQKGLLFFAPLVLLALIYAASHRREAARNRLLLLSGAAYLLLVLLWVDPAGGWCYGPRLLVPLCAAMAPLVAAALAESQRWRKAMLLVAIPSFLLQWMAATHPFLAFGNVDALALVRCDWFALMGGAVVSAGAAKLFSAWCVGPRAPSPLSDEE